MLVPTPMITRLDHIAIAVPDLSAAIRRFTEDLGLSLEGTEDVEAALTQTAFLPVDRAHVELISPLEGRGPVQKYLEKRGGGLHHLCFQTDDIAGDMARLRARGYRFLSEAPTPGAHGAQVAWIHPQSADGVLIELAQRPDAGRTP